MRAGRWELGAAAAALALAAAALVASGCAAEPLEEVEPEEADSGGKSDDATGRIRVSELLFASREADGAWVELVNGSSEPIDLDGWYVSFGRRRVVLSGVDGHPSIVPPGGVALIVDEDSTAVHPAWLPVLVPSVDLSEVFTSRRMIVRDPAKVISDRADATYPTVPAGVARERKADGTFAASGVGATPGARNTTASAARIRTFFANPPIDTEDLIAPELVAIIDGATTSLDGAFYQVGDAQMIDAFLRAEARGVRVRLVTDTRYVTDPDYVAGYERLIAGGVEVRDDRRSGRMHNKFLVVDGRSVFTGSYNLVGDDGPKFQHLDNAIHVESEAFAAIHTIELEEMFGGTFGPNKEDNTPHEVWVDGARIEVYFAPTDKPKTAILRELARATDNVYFAAFSFYQTDLAATLVERHRAGVDVRGVVDDTGGGVDSQYPTLVAAGIDARRPIVDVWLHHKFILVNYGSADPVVITGSYNFSDKADRTNDEAVYVIHDRAIAEEYYRIYRSIYDAAGGPNTDTTGLATVTVSEVFPAESATTAVPFIELVNHGDTSIDLASLSITDRDGAPLPLGPMVDEGVTVLAPGARAVVLPAFALEAGDPLLLLDARRRAVATFDAPRYPGKNKSLARDDMASPDWDATFTPRTPTPGD
jgi:phosphatidylserine/phosphatidylglycerophosphate/cardiolipin synthase-like enzyme